MKERKLPSIEVRIRDVPRTPAYDAMWDNLLKSLLLKQPRGTSEGQDANRQEGQEGQEGSA